MLTFEQWGPVKAANTYGEGAQLPVYVADDGTIYRQSMAILKMLAYEHGYGTENAQQEYEAEWYFATVVDMIEGKPERFVIMKDDPSDEELVAGTKVFTDFLAKIEGRLADGRAHLCGDKITACDFAMLAFVTSCYENPNLKHAKMKEGVAAAIAGASNLQRCLAPMRELCAAGIAAAPQAPI